MSGEGDTHDEAADDSFEDEWDNAEQAGHERASGPVTPRALLRQALVSDDDPRFPWWLPLPGMALALGWAAFTAATAGADFMQALLWPGAGIFALTTVAAWLGWQLEID